MFIFISLKTEIARSVKGPTFQGPHAEDAMAKPLIRAEKFGDLITADHKVFSENCESRNNHRLQKFLSQIGSLKSFTLTIPWNSAKLVKISPGIIARLHHGIAERAVRRVKEGTSAVLLQSGLNESWWADSMECYTHLRNITDVLSDGKTPCERRFGQPFKGPIIPFGSLVEYHPITAKDQSRIHHFGKTVLPGLFFGYALYAGRIWKGDVLIADLEELETMDASEIYSKRLNAKEVIFPKQRELIYFSNRRWTNQNPWRRPGTENIHFDTASTNSRKD